MTIYARFMHKPLLNKEVFIRHIFNLLLFPIQDIQYDIF